MKIIYAWHFDELKPQLWSTPLGLANAFIKAGHEVEYYAFDPNNCNLETLLLKSYSDQYDFIFISMAGPSTSFDNELIRIKDKIKIPIYMEFGDDLPHLPFFSTRKHYVDGIFTLDNRCHETYLRENLPSNWMPCWCDDEIFFRQNNPNRQNICVTTCIGDRPLLNEFSQIFGDKFICKNVWAYENSVFYNSGTFTYQYARFNELTRRIFEAGGCGNAIITNRISPGTRINDLFVEDEDICYFSSQQEALQKMEMLYNDDAYRTTLANNIYNKIQSNHLVSHRVQQILDYHIS